MKQIFTVIKVNPMPVAHEAVFSSEDSEEARKYCDEQNAISNPIFGEKGLVKGSYYCLCVEYFKDQK